MKKSIARIVAICAFMVLATVLSTGCSSASKQETNVNGMYVFDGDAFKALIKGTEDPMLKNMPEDVMQQTLDGLKEFKIEITGDQATATFGTMVVKGTISKVSEAGGEIKYLMTPTEEDKKKDTVTLLFKDSQLTLDPGKSESDKMFFKKTT